MSAALLNQLRVIAPRAELPSTPKDLSQALPGIPRLSGRTHTDRPRRPLSSPYREPRKNQQESTSGHMNRI